MLDQSFSADNFLKIIASENRKGKNLEKEFFPTVYKHTKDIAEINQEIHFLKRSQKERGEELIALLKRKDEIKNTKESILWHELHTLSLQLENKNINFPIAKIETDDKPIYVLEKRAESFFAIKQLQHNVRRTFKVKQANRFAIVNQVKVLLKDNFPKVVVRTDIKSFYESIPYDKLISKINDTNLLSFLSKKFISTILNEYYERSGSSKKIGLARGVGISAYLAELYMRDIDKKIAALKDVTYFARYVDDIIVVFTPQRLTTYQDSQLYVDQIKSAIENGTDLLINETKTSVVELVRKDNKDEELEFLGYKFKFNNSEFRQIRLTNNKIKKYKDRIDKTFDSYQQLLPYNAKSARRLLIQRINFLTGNTRLENNKDSILVGVFYSNSLLSNDLEDLIALDIYLQHKISLSIGEQKLRERLARFSFKNGFESKKYVSFTGKKKTSLQQVFWIWKKKI